MKVFETERMRIEQDEFGYEVLLPDVNAVEDVVVGRIEKSFGLLLFEPDDTLEGLKAAELRDIADFMDSLEYGEIKP